MQNKAIIVLNGTLYDAENVRLQIKEINAYVICADGGLSHVQNLGITPDLLIGDMDSVSNIPSTVTTDIYPAIKDDTDALLAVKYAISNGVKQIYIIAPFGGRIDHTIANISLLRYGLDQNVSITMLDGKNSVCVLKKGKITLSNRVQYVSFFPLGECAKISLQGFHYDGVTTISSSYSVAVSNQYDGLATIDVLDEPVIMVEIQ